MYRSTRHHGGFGVHSPFVFNFITKVVEEKCSHYSFYDTELLCRQLLLREGEITYPDWQYKGKRETRSISEVVKRESIRPKHGALLFRLANYFKSENILQIETTVGLSTLYLTSYATGLRCIVLENVSGFATIARQVFAKEGRNPTDLRIGNYKDLLSQALNDIDSLDFALFNTLYEQRNNLQLFNECMKYACNDTVFVFEGVRVNRKMREPQEEVYVCPEVMVTLDPYLLGIVSFNKRLHKRDYIVYFQDSKQVRYEEEYYLYRNRR